MQLIKNPKLPYFKTIPGKLTGGAEGSRTPDPHNAIVVLYQLSYDPTKGTAIVWIRF